MICRESTIPSRSDQAAAIIRAKLRFVTCDSDSFGQPSKLISKWRKIGIDERRIALKGLAKLVDFYPEGRMLLICVTGAGHILGLVALFPDALYRVNVETIAHSTVKSIPHAKFLRFMATYPDVALIAPRALALEYDSAPLSARRIALQLRCG